MPDYLSFVYEKIAREIILNDTDSFVAFEQVGKWWDKNEEIDIVGLSREKNAIVFGEVKWSQKLVDVNVLEELRVKAKKVNWGDSKKAQFYVLFSRKGFTKEMMDLATKEGIFLFRGDEIIGFQKNKN